MKTIKCYKIEMSRGTPIPIDGEELPNVVKAISTGKPCVLKQGIFNPSFYVSITKDSERQKAVIDGFGSKLMDIFKNTEIRKLESGK